ncbi:MAG: acyl carrier protein [Lachnospiraceae bacterium]
MTNTEKYRDTFAAAFEADKEKVTGFVYQDTPEWDSIAHMMLMSGLEDAFGIELEPEDMLAVTSYAAGIEVLAKKGIAFE